MNRYEVYRASDGIFWALYEVGGGDCALVALFSDESDAEFARAAFAERDRRRGGGPAEADEPAVVG